MSNSSFIVIISSCYEVILSFIVYYSLWPSSCWIALQLYSLILSQNPSSSYCGCQKKKLHHQPDGFLTIHPTMWYMFTTVFNGFFSQPSSYPDALCMVYLPTKLGDFGVNVGKYSSTMVRIWDSQRFVWIPHFIPRGRSRWSCTSAMLPPIDVDGSATSDLWKSQGSWAKRNDLFLYGESKGW